MWKIQSSGVCAIGNVKEEVTEFPEHLSGQKKKKKAHLSEGKEERAVIELHVVRLFY